MTKKSLMIPHARLALLPLLFVLLTLGALTAQGAPATNWMWIWARDTTRPPETVFFRQTFRLPRNVASAKLLISADDSFLAYLNENKRPVAQGHDWSTVQAVNVTRLLRTGDNLLAVEVRNNAGPGGLLYKLIVTLANGKSLTFFSDARVRLNRHPPATWQNLDFDDKNWPTAREIAPFGGGVWKPLHGALLPDYTRLVRLWDIRAGGRPDEDPYTRPRHVGDRMLLSANVTNPSEMQILASAGFTLFQTDSDHLSTEEVAPHQWDWHLQDAARQAVQNLGLDWCYFPHEAFPPKWYRNTVPFTRIQCLEHQQPVEAFSPWDSTWPGFIDQGYDALAHQFGAGARPGPVGKAVGAGLAPADRAGLAAICVGIHGDYGEAGLLMGARVSVAGQKEDWLQRFGNLHNHLGWWCADPLARADFRAKMLQKYGTLERLNAVWKREFQSPEQIAYPDRPRAEARQEWLDFVEWYQHAVGHAIELNLDAARRHFPESLLMLPAGFADENPRGGNDNSLIPKLAARYKADVRSTHGAFYPLAENSATMLGRLGSASRFYGVPFWTEPPGLLTPEQEVERIFEDVSEGAKGHFDWASNIMAARDVYYRYGKYMRVEKPVVDVAMFYPAMAQKLRPNEGFQPLFAQACAYVRDIANFDIVDDRMVMDGCLSKFRILALWEGTLADQATLDKIKAWVQDGGVLMAYDFGKVATFEGDLSWYNDLFGYIQELAPARITERYEGAVLAQYRLQVGTPEGSDYLAEGGEGWWLSEAVDGVPRRWTKASASVRLPVDPDKRYTLIIRAGVPPEAASLVRRVLVNGHEIGQLSAPGDVTYRFPLSDSVLENHKLSTLTFQCETFVPAKLVPDSKDTRTVGVWVQSVQLVEEGTPEAADAPPPPGAMRRELDLRLLNTNWARRYGKGLTIYFPANRRLLKGYIEVLRRAIYHLSDIDPDRRNALPIDDAQDGVYATLFTDKILYCNTKDTKVTKTVTIPAEAFAAWKDEVVTPTRTTWTLNLEPHSLEAIYLATPPEELLFECEGFTDLGAAKPVAAPDCSPGTGPTCVPLSRGASISTRIAINTPGRYTIYTRCLRQDRPVPVDVLVDDQAVAPLNVRAGQTLLSGAVSLRAGRHTITLRARPGQDVRADFVLLTNDPTIAGYDFPLRTAPIE